MEVGHNSDGTLKSIDRSKVGLDQVDNTADADKPISGPATIVLAEKVDTSTKVNGHELLGDITVTATDVGLGNVTNDAQLKVSQLDTDAALTANLDTNIPSQKAVKAYADAIKFISKIIGTYNFPIYQTSILREDLAESFLGNGVYTLFPGRGFVGVLTQNCNISQFVGNIFVTGTENVDVSVYILNSMPTSGINLSTLTPAYSFTVLNANFPKSSSISNTINFPVPLSVSLFPSGTTYFLIVCKTATTDLLRIGYWTTQHEGYPTTGFVMVTSSNQLAYGSAGYYATGFRLIGVNDITKRTVPSMGPELVVNPNLDISPYSPHSGWSEIQTNSNGQVLDETSLVDSGGHAIKMVQGTSHVSYEPQALQNIPVVPLGVYTFTFKYRTDNTRSFSYAVYDATHLIYIVLPIVPLAATVYTLVTLNVTIPAGCTSVKLFFFGGAMYTTGAASYVDTVSFKLNIIDTFLNNISLDNIINGLNALGISFSGAGITATNVNSAIVEVNAKVGSSGMAGVTPRVILPPDITAVVGEKLQVFIRGAIEAMNPYFLPYDFITTLNQTYALSYPRYLDYTPPVGDVGTKTLTVNVHDEQRNLLSSDTCNVVVVNPTGQPASNKNVVCIGDSLTGGNVWTTEFYRLLTQSGGTPAGKGYGNIKFVGDVPLNGFLTQGAVAWGGWSYAQHMGTAGATSSGYVLTGTFDKDRNDVNAIYAYGTSTYRIMSVDGRLQIALYSGADLLPASGTLTWVSGGTHHADIVYSAIAYNLPSGSVFWNPAKTEVNFTDWLARLGGSGNIDVAYILLGWNEVGIGPLATDHAVAITAAKAMIDRIHTEYPSCKIRLLGLEVPSPSGGLGANYGSSSAISDYYYTLRNTNGYNLAMESIGIDANYSSFVRYTAIRPQFDSENNMSVAATPVNSRNATTELLGTNGVHPATAGYYQIADVAYRDFIRTFCS